MQRSFIHRIRIELLVGLVAGVVFLGIGGRGVMRLISLATDRPPALSPSGTLTVILYGAGVGLIGAVIHLLLVRFMPDRGMLRETIFGVILSLLTGRGLAGQMSVPASLFFVLAGLYGLTLVLISKRYLPGKGEGE